MIEKFLAGSVTEEEAEDVLDWFGTDEGQIWLSDRFDQDVQAAWRTMDVHPKIL